MIAAVVILVIYLKLSYNITAPSPLIIIFKKGLIKK
jgi:hypothetical protein